MATSADRVSTFGEYGDGDFSSLKPSCHSSGSLGKCSTNFCSCLKKLSTNRSHKRKTQRTCWLLAVWIWDTRPRFQTNRFLVASPICRPCFLQWPCSRPSEGSTEMEWWTYWNVNTNKDLQNLLQNFDVRQEHLILGPLFFCIPPKKKRNWNELKWRF